MHVNYYHNNYLKMFDLAHYCFEYAQASLEDSEVQRAEGDSHGRFRRRQQEGVYSRINSPRQFVRTSVLVANLTTLLLLKCEIYFITYRMRSGTTSYAN